MTTGLAMGLATSATGCDALVDDMFTSAEWDKIKTLSPLPDVPKDTTNKYADSAAAAKLGQSLFFDKRYSGPIIVGSDGTNGGNGQVGETGKVACASCHDVTKFWIDTRSKPNNTSLGAAWVARNASTPVNASYYKWLENDGLRDSQWSDSLTDPEDPGSMNGSRLRIAHLLWNKYRDQYNAIFTETPLPAALDPAAPDAARFPADGKPSDAMSDWSKMTAADQEQARRIYANFGKAMQAYLRLLVSKNAPFDRYVAGNTSAISTAAKRGLKLFIGKANCVACHNTPLFSDNEFHVTGMVVKGEHANPMERGRLDAINALLDIEFRADSAYSDDVAEGKKRLMGLVKDDPQWEGMWRTKGLREIAETAPYTHAGQLATLKDVISFYNKGGDDSGFIGKKDKLMKPLNLSDAEINDLVEFLKTLTGDPVPASLAKDTSAP
ncbi:MAG: cytochrome c peroxidase [Polyangia bacterium]